MIKSNVRFMIVFTTCSMVCLFRCFICLHQTGGYERVVWNGWLQLWLELRIRVAFKSFHLLGRMWNWFWLLLSHKENQIRIQIKPAETILRFYLSVFRFICDPGSVDKCEVVKSTFLFDRRLQTVLYKPKGSLNAGLQFLAHLSHHWITPSIWLFIRLEDNEVLQSVFTLSLFEREHEQAAIHRNM